MTTSTLTTGTDSLLSGLVDRITLSGYAYDPLTTSFERYLATALGGLTGGTNLYLTHGGPSLLSELLTALGGVGNSLTMSPLQTFAAIIDLPVGP